MFDLPVRLPSPLRVIVSWIVFYVILFGVVIAALPLLRRFPWMAGGYLPILGFMLVTSMLMGLVPSLQRGRARRKVRRLLAIWGDAPLDALLRRVHRSRPWLSGPAAFSELIKRLGMQGRGGLVFRAGRADCLTPATPITVDFEPRLLDQTDEAFVELEEALRDVETTAAVQRDPRTHGTGPSRQTTPGLLHRVWRNVTLKEGRLSLLIFLAFFGWVAYGAYQRWRLTPGLVLGTVFLFMRLFQSPGGGGGPGWLVVPTGLILRVPRKERTSDYFMPRDEVTLGVLQVGRQKWQVHVADVLMQAHTVATPREVAFLLRAWQAPVQPSSVRLHQMARFISAE